ncbi:hypothetical protein MFLAVUS_003729 [Mucor flavus]|uniref:polynucleotide adenylyltransferase n=1 Tax=Mucor flavus TaxID=439312 RepID=A0ABP9YTW4_9FUNG
MDAPWSSKETLATKDRMERLSKEILDFERYIEPTKEEALNRDTLLYQIAQLVESLWPGNNTITAFGSSVTGLVFPASDVDVNINFDELPKKNVIDILKVLRKRAVDAKIFRFNDTTLAAKAKVPVLMGTDENNVSIDITIQNECFSSNRTAAWIKEYPALKPLFMVLKQSIGNFRFSDLPVFEPLSAKFAGLASYSLICLIVSYLQLQAPKDMDPSKKEYYGTLLMGFLKFYSKFEAEKRAIGFEDGGKYYSKDDCPFTLETKAGKLTIVDPDIPGVNVARSTLKFDRVKLMFAHAYKLLLNRMTESSKTDSILSSILKVEHHYHGDQRSQGTRFKASYVWIENGPPQKKNMRGNNQFGGNRRGMPYDRNQSRSHQRYERQDESSPDNRRESYRYTNRYEQPDEYNQREYQRHKRNNNSHLAQHYKQKADRSRR